MDEFIEKKLLKLRGVTFTDECGRVIPKENIKGRTHFIARRKLETEKSGINVFTFEDYMIKPFSTFDFAEKFNKGRTIPLKVMQGKILREVGKMYYIKVNGIYEDSNYCLHCLKPIQCHAVCDDCFRYFNVNDIEEVEFEGFVPKKSCSIEEI